MQRTLIGYILSFYQRGSEVAYIHRRGYRTRRWSYRKIAEAASQFARELAQRRIAKGDRVLIWGENCAEWVVAFLGCILRGAVVVPMDRVSATDFVERVAQQVEVRLLVCSRKQPVLSGSVPVLFLEGLSDSVEHHSRSPYVGPQLEHEDAVQIVFTSGTTADPKGVVISHANVLANIEPLETEMRPYLKYERIFHPLRFLNLLPLSHVFGQLMGIFVPQLLGGTVVFQDTLNPSEIIRTIHRERVSVLVAVPRLLDALRDKIERDLQAEGKLEWFRKQFDEAANRHFLVRWWRFRRIHSQFGWKFWAFISGGAALDTETELFWGRLGFAVIQGYGLTETTSLVSVNHPLRLGRGSVGKVLPGREIRLDSSGEILVRGESVAMGYYHGKELVPVVGEEGWFHTGDMGEFDDNGNLYFKGRRKNVIVTPAGMNVYPEDLEAALRRQPEVWDCAVVGLAEGANAEPCAVLIPYDQAQDPEPIVKRANELLAEYQRMRRWCVWPDHDFPRTATQKPRLNVIQEVIESRIKGEAKAPPAGGVLADLIRGITRRSDIQLTAEADLVKDLNLSSIDRVELLSALEDRYHADLNETRFSALTTVGELEKMLRQPASRRSDYRYPRWAQRWPVTLIRLAVYYLITWPATVLMCYPRIRGRQNLNEISGPLLIVSNHITQVDIAFILVALPPLLRHRIAVAMLGEMLQAMRHPPPETGFLKRLREKLSYSLVVALFNVFPLPQETGFRESFSFTGESVDRGYSIVVFPEGHRTQNGALSSFRSGIGLLARNLDLPVVPVRIDGLFALKQKRKKIARPGTVTVTVGAPIRFAADDDPEEIARILERQVRALEAW